MNTIVHKFGGTSLANADCYQNVAQQLTGQAEIVILSAAAKTTRQLRDMLFAAAKGKSFANDIKNLFFLQVHLIQPPLPEAEIIKLRQNLQDDFENLSELLQTVEQTGSYSAALKATILGYGEYWSTRLMSSYLAQNYQVLALDARDILFVDKTASGTIEVNWQRSQDALAKALEKQHYDIVLIPGYIASTNDGQATTLNFNGSDFSATIFAKLFNANKLIKWTDTNGLHTSDPRQVSNSMLIKQIDYQTALSFAYFGASIIHPQALLPVMNANIPMQIKNSFDPNGASTCISNHAMSTTNLVHGIVHNDEIALLTINSNNPLKNNTILAKALYELANQQITVAFNNQDNSGQAIYLIVPELSAQYAHTCLNNLFAADANNSVTISYNQQAKYTAIALIRGNLTEHCLEALNSTFQVLNEINIQPITTSYNSFANNITILLEARHKSALLNALHNKFFPQ